MSNEELIFCMDEGNDIYGWFWHEADVLLYALGREVADKKITADQAREMYAQYYDVEDTYLIDPDEIEEEKEAILEDWERYYTPKQLESVLEELVGEYGNFPLNEEVDHLPNSRAFWYAAAELNIPGVGFSDDISPASGEIFEVHGSEALLALQEAFQGRCRIVVLDDLMEYTSTDSDEAKKFIEQARSEQLNS